MYDWTFITAFIPISDYDDDYGSSNRKPEEYLNYSNYICSLDIPLIIFTDYQYIELIRAKRQNFVSKTIVVEYKFTDLPKYKYFDILREERRKIVEMPNKYSGGYYLLVNSKNDFLMKAIELDPFNSKYFAWIDFGLSYICKNYSEFIQEITSLKPEKINIMSIQRITQNDVLNYKNFLLTDSWKTSAQFYFGNKDNIIWFSKEFDKLFIECIEEKIIVLEEKLYGLIIGNNRNKFDVWIGQYCYCLYNAFKPRANIDMILSRINEEQDASNNNEAYRLIKYLFQSKDLLNNQQILQCLNSLVINCYYINKKEEGLKAGKEIINLCKSDDKIRKIIENNYQYYNMNLSFYEQKPTLKLLIPSYIDINIINDTNENILYIYVSNPPINKICTLPLSNPRYLLNI